jgi:sugar O-acyltransferase (sialic acid O-acetyltransferase NeuD family)
MSHVQRTRVLVVGAGGFGREVMQYVRDTFLAGQHQVVGFLDDTPDDARVRSLGLPLLGSIDAYAPDDDERFVVAIGDPAARARVARRLAARGARFLTIVHPRAYVASSARVGEGCIVAPFASVGAGAVLEEQVQLHFYASAAHDTCIGGFAALSHYSVVNGGAVLEEGVFLGTRSTINPLKKVGAYAKIAAGAVVYQDVPPGALASGNPAKSRVLQTGDRPSAGNGANEGDGEPMADERT